MSCRKEKYDKKGAQTVLNYLRESKSIPKRPQRIYECPKCGYWHITKNKEYK